MNKTSTIKNYKAGAWCRVDGKSLWTEIESQSAWRTAAWRQSRICPTSLVFFFNSLISEATAESRLEWEEKEKKSL